MKVLSNLVAECPQCTMKQGVLIDVMRAKGGWMRCGGCKEIFDGFEAMSAQDYTRSADAPGKLELPAKQAEAVKAESEQWVVGPRRRPALKRIQTPEPLLRGAVKVDGKTKDGIDKHSDASNLVHALRDQRKEGQAAVAEPPSLEPLISVHQEVRRRVPQALKDDDFIVEWSKEAMGESMKNGEESIQKASKVNKKERDDQVSSGESAPWEARRRALRVGAICDEACAEVIDSRTTKTKWENEAEGRKEAIRKIMESGGSWLHTWGTRAMGGHYAWSRMVGAPKSKAWRTGMALVCVGLLSTSAAQGVFFYKEQIAAYHPQVRPFMERACKAMGCLVGLVQAKSELDLDGAQVLLDDQGRLIFTATLKSRAEIESQAPRLWLALEGEDGEVVAARTIEAEKWLGEKSIKPGQELEAKMTFPAIKESLSGFKARLIWGAQG